MSERLQRRLERLEGLVPKEGQPETWHGGWWPALTPGLEVDQYVWRDRDGAEMALADFEAYKAAHERVFYVEHLGIVVTV